MVELQPQGGGRTTPNLRSILPRPCGRGYTLPEDRREFIVKAWEIAEYKLRPHYLAPLKELCNRKFKSRFIAELEGNGSARAVGHQERVLVESLEVLNHDLLQMRGIVCGWE